MSGERKRARKELQRRKKIADVVLAQGRELIEQGQHPETVVRGLFGGTVAVLEANYGSGAAVTFLDSVLADIRAAGLDSDMRGTVH